MSMLHAMNNFSEAYQNLDKRYWDWIKTTHYLTGKIPQMVWAEKCLSAEELSLICEEYATNYGKDNPFYVNFKSILNDKLLRLWIEA